MNPSPFAAIRGPALTLAALALLAVGSSCSHDVPTAVAPTPSAPAPASPRGVVDLFQWAMDNRNLPRIEELFTNDFQLVYARTDSAGIGYRTNHFLRVDMLIAADNLFAASRSISLVFDGDPLVSDDLRDGRNPKWHQQVLIPSITLTINKTDGSVLRVGGGLLFYATRGDSAALPQDLLDRGIKPDSTRWFIGRLEDQTNQGSIFGGPAPLTLGRLLLLYRQ